MFSMEKRPDPAKSTMDSKTTRLRLLKILLIVSIVATFIHFTDNYLYFERYPQPAWITRPGVYRSWIIWTVFAIAGYALYRNGRFWISHLCLTIYSFCGITSLGHYLYGSMFEFSPKMHFFILTDGAAGLAILGFIVWSSLILRERFTISRNGV